MTERAVSRLLIVEDDPEIQYLLSTILADDDREILTVGSGAEASEVLARQDIDLVVLDLILPDVDGRSLLTAMRERPETASVPVVVVSARGGAEIRQDCFALGADYFTEKPFDPDAVAADIEARLQRGAGQARVSAHDPVTGLLNRFGLMTQGGDVASAYGVGLMQLDGFVALSEDWGWEAAESVLLEVGGAVRAAIDSDVLAARLGGGEFALRMTVVSIEEAAQKAERLLDAIRSLPIEDAQGETFRLTASMGVLMATADTSLDDALETVRPRLFRARDAGGNQVVAEDEEADGAPNTRVLVAEDDEISATILLHRLRKEGLDIVRFNNGLEAYEAALEETPALVILDIKMPGMDGFEVLERLRRTPSYSRVPIILLTSMGSEADVVRGFQLGADDYILKPFSPIELSARVRRLLNRGRSASAV